MLLFGVQFQPACEEAERILFQHSAFCALLTDLFLNGAQHMMLQKAEFECIQRACFGFVIAQAALNL